MRTMRLATCAMVLLATTAHARAAVVNFTDLATYNATVGPHTVITFQEFPEGTLLTTEYLPQGVTFDGTDQIITTGSFVSDGVGDAGNGQIELLFTTPQSHIGAEFPGALRIQIFSGATLVGTSDDFAGVGAGFFGGVLSDVPFDRALITDWDDDFVFIDNLHFGGAAVEASVPEPSTLALLGFGAIGLANRARRRRKD